MRTFKSGSEDFAVAGWQYFKYTFIFFALYLLILRVQLGIDVTLPFAVITVPPATRANVVPQVPVAQDGTVTLSWFLISLRTTRPPAQAAVSVKVTNEAGKSIWNTEDSLSPTDGCCFYTLSLRPFTGHPGGNYLLRYNIRPALPAEEATEGRSLRSLLDRVNNLVGSLFHEPWSYDGTAAMYYMPSLEDLTTVSIVQGHLENYPDTLRQWNHNFYSSGRPPIEDVVPIAQIPPTNSNPAAFVAGRNGLFYHQTGDGYAAFWAGGNTPPGDYNAAAQFTEGEFAPRWIRIRFRVEANLRPGVYGFSEAEDRLDVLIRESESSGGGDRRRVNLSNRILDLDGEEYLRDSNSRAGMRWGRWMIRRNVAVRSLVSSDDRIFREGMVWYFDFGTEAERAKRPTEENITAAAGDGVGPPRSIRLRAFNR